MQRRRLLAISASLLMLLVLLAAGRNAASAHRAITASLLVDPFGDFSAVRFPTWPEAAPLRFPDRLIAVDDRPVERSPVRPNRIVLPAVWDSLEQARSSGLDEVKLTFEHDGTRETLKRPLLPLGGDEIAFFFGFYALAALATFTSGVVVFLGAAHRPAARAYALWSLGAALFLVTFFDYHSTARLTPVFGAGAALTDAGFLWLAWAFPAPPRRLASITWSLVVGLSTAFGVAGLVLGLAPWLPFDVKLVRIGLSASTPPCLLALVITLGARVASSSGEARGRLRSAAIGLVTIPALLSIGFILNMLAGEAFLQLLLPLLTPAIPLAIAYSLARHDLLRTEAVLTRKLAFLPVAFLGASLGLLTWLAVRYAALQQSMSWIDPVAIGLLIALAAAFLGQRLIAKLFFSATDAYRPTIEDLSERISTLNDEASVLRELARLLSAWLPLDTARVMPAKEVDVDAQLTATERESLRLGQRVRRGDVVWVPMRFHGELTGAFCLGRKEGGALFTTADMALLDTMAALGGVALHHANALRELDLLRRSQVSAARDERTGVLDTLSAEIAHELGHPLRYFRALFHDRAPSAPLDPDEIAYAVQEIERMDRMRQTLETLETPPPRKDPLALAAPADHARFLLRDEIAQGTVTVRVDVDRALRVRAELGPLVQVLVNLLRNALQAAGNGGSAGIRARRVDAGVALETWDTGPGISEEVRPTLFRVWGVTTRKGGKGLGLMVCSRIVHQLHWALDFNRGEGETVFRILIPTADMVTE